MKVKVTLECVVDLGDCVLLSPLDIIEQNFESDKKLIDHISWGEPVSQFKATVEAVEDSLDA